MLSKFPPGNIKQYKAEGDNPWVGFPKNRLELILWLDNGF